MRSAYNDAGSLQASFLRNPRLWKSPSSLRGLPPPLPSGPPHARRAHLQPEGLWGRAGEGGMAEHQPRSLPPPLTPPHKGGGNPHAVRIAALRQAVARLETAALRGEVRHLPLGVPEMQAHLPGPGLACGVLHEVSAAAHGDPPA